METFWHTVMFSKTSCAGLWLFFFVTDLAYNIALCYYSLKQYASALKYIAEIIERGIREHPGICKIFFLGVARFAVL